MKPGRLAGATGKPITGSTADGEKADTHSEAFSEKRAVRLEGENGGAAPVPREEGVPPQVSALPAHAISSANAPAGPALTSTHGTGQPDVVDLTVDEEMRPQDGFDSYAAGSSGTGHGGSTSSAGATRPIRAVHTLPLAMNPDNGITVPTSYGHVIIYGQDELMASPRGRDLLKKVMELTGCTVATPGDPSIDLHALAIGCNPKGHGHSSGEGASSDKTKVDTALENNSHLGWIVNVASKLVPDKKVSAPSAWLMTYKAGKGFHATHKDGGEQQGKSKILGKIIAAFGNVSCVAFCLEEDKPNGARVEVWTQPGYAVYYPSGLMCAESLYFHFVPVNADNNTVRASFIIRQREPADASAGSAGSAEPLAVASPLVLVDAEQQKARIAHGCANFVEAFDYLQQCGLDGTWMPGSAQAGGLATMAAGGIDAVTGKHKLAVANGLLGGQKAKQAAIAAGKPMYEGPCLICTGDAAHSTHVVVTVCRMRNAKVVCGKAHFSIGPRMVLPGHVLGEVTRETLLQLGRDAVAFARERGVFLTKPKASRYGRASGSASSSSQATSIQGYFHEQGAGASSYNTPQSNAGSTHALLGASTRSAFPTGGSASATTPSNLLGPYEDDSYVETGRVTDCEDYADCEQMRRAQGTRGDPIPRAAGFPTSSAVMADDGSDLEFPDSDDEDEGDESVIEISDSEDDKPIGPVRRGPVRRALWQEGASSSASAVRELSASASRTKGKASSSARVTPATKAKKEVSPSSSASENKDTPLGQVKFGVQKKRKAAEISSSSSSAGVATPSAKKSRLAKPQSELGVLIQEAIDQSARLPVGSFSSMSPE